MQHNNGFINLVITAKEQVKELNVEETHKLLKSNPEYILIDVREDHEWNEQRIPNAIHLGKGIIERDIEKLYSKTTPLVLYCGGGYRSALAAQNLQFMGYNQVYSMDGGIKAWGNAGYVIDTHALNNS